MAHDRLSAFLDGELGSDEVDALLEQLSQTGQRELLLRMSLAQSVLAGGMSPPSSGFDLSESVAAAVREQPLHPADRVARVVPLRSAARLGGKRFQVPAAGWALAASVVFAAVLLVSQTPPDGDAGTALTAAAPAPSGTAATVSTYASPERATARAPVVADVRLASSSGKEPEPAAAGAGRELVIAAPGQQAGSWPTAQSPAVQRQLNTLLINHARYGGGYAMGGPLGYARVAAQRGEIGPEGDR